VHPGIVITRPEYQGVKVICCFPSIIEKIEIQPGRPVFTPENNPERVLLTVHWYATVATMQAKSAIDLEIFPRYRIDVFCRDLSFPVTSKGRGICTRVAGIDIDTPGIRIRTV
jgi:hypothetical protein